MLHGELVIVFLVAEGVHEGELHCTPPLVHLTVFSVPTVHHCTVSFRKRKRKQTVWMSIWMMILIWMGDRLPVQSPFSNAEGRSRSPALGVRSGAEGGAARNKDGKEWRAKKDG